MDFWFVIGSQHFSLHLTSESTGSPKGTIGEDPIFSTVVSERGNPFPRREKFAHARSVWKREQVFQTTETVSTNTHMRPDVLGKEGVQMRLISRSSVAASDGVVQGSHLGLEIDVSTSGSVGDTSGRFEQ